jgi:galactose mutarotase-like enzyme
VVRGHALPTASNGTAGFNVPDEHPAFSMSGDGRRITLEFLENYRYAQIFAPKGKDFAALEPMTAPTSELTCRQGLRLVEPGKEFRAAFCIRVQA